MIKIAFDASSDSPRSTHTILISYSRFINLYKKKNLFIFFLLSISYAVLGSAVLYAEG